MTPKSIAKLISWSSLALIILPPVLFYIGSIGQPLMNQLLIAGTVIWFASTPVWLKSQ